MVIIPPIGGGALAWISSSKYRRRGPSFYSDGAIGILRESIGKGDFLSMGGGDSSIIP